MALKALLETLDGVDDAVKPFYAESDGKFVLAVDGIDDHPEVANLKTAYGRTKTDKEAAKQEAASLKAKIAELEKGAPDTAATQAKIASYEAQIEQIKAQASEWQGKYTGVTRDQALTGALQSAGITNPTFLKAAQAMLAGSVKLGEDGSVLVETGMGPKMLGDYVKAWAASEGSAFVSPAQGGGAKGNDRPAMGKSMTRAQFEQLDAAAKASAMSAGTVLTD